LKPFRLPDSKERIHWFLVGAVVLLGLLLRMGWPTLAEFKWDEANVVRQSLAIAYDGRFTAIGAHASVGSSHMPLNFYLMALPLRLWADPVAAILFAGLLNGLAVLACYLFGRSWFDRRAGLIAAFLFAVCPWAILYGRKIWSQNLPLVTLAFIAAVLTGFVRGSHRAQLAAWIAFAALIGLHWGGLAFLPILLIFMALEYKRISPRTALLMGPAACGLAVLPYIIQDAFQGGHNVNGLLHYGGRSGTFTWDALRYAFQLTGSADIETHAGTLYPQFRAGLPDLWWLNIVLMALLGLALIYALYQAFRGPQERRRPLQILLLWFMIPILLQARPSTPVQPHYFIILYPVQFLLIGNLLSDLLARLPTSRPTLHVLCAVPLLLYGGFQIAVWGQMLNFMATHPTTGGYGIPLRFPRAAALEARRLAGSDEIIVLANSADIATNENLAVLDALLYTVPHRLIDGRYALVIPDAPSAVYLAGPTETGDALHPALTRLENLSTITSGPAVVMAPSEINYRTFRRSAPDRDDTLADLTRFPGDFPLANNAVFAAAGLPESAQPGTTADIWLAWWLRAAPPAGKDYHFYVHLLDAQGQLRAQFDGAPFLTSRWHPMDLVLQRFPLDLPADLPPGTYQLRAGSYSYPDLQPVPVVDPSGAPIDDGVTLDTLTIK